MKHKLEDLIRIAYHSWKDGLGKIDNVHISEEELACLIEGRLSAEEAQNIEQHLLCCDTCMRLFALSIELQKIEPKEVPQALLERVKKLTQDSINGEGLLEIVLRLKGRMFELLSSTGDILVGDEFLPVPVLRSRSIRDFRDRVIILKDLKDIRIEIKVESKRDEEFNLHVLVKEKYSQKPLKDVRISLSRDDQELESYVVDAGSIIFEHLLAGRYNVAISRPDADIVSVTVEIKI